MKNMIKMLASVFVLVAANNSSFGQATATATATATIVTPISISKTADMNFGNIAVQSTTGGTVVLNPAGSRTSTGGVTLPATTGTVSSASFVVNGTSSYTYSITLPGSITLTHSGGVETMSAASFTSTPSGTGTLNGGSQVLDVGATLSVAAGQMPGVYATLSPFDVTVNYN